MPAPILDNFYFQSTKKFRNALAFVLLFSAFIPGALWVFKDKLIQLPLSVRKANNFEQLAFLLFLNLFLLVLPFVSITCFEIIHSKKKLVGTSVFRVLRSDGYRLADVWYYFLHSLTGVLPLTVAFISLGSSEFNNQLSTWMNAGFSSTFDAGLILNNQVLFLALAVLFIDLSHYIKHRCQHSISLIWDLHEFHGPSGIWLNFVVPGGSSGIAWTQKDLRAFRGPSGNIMNFVVPKGFAWVRFWPHVAPS